MFSFAVDPNAFATMQNCDFHAYFHFKSLF